MKKMIMKAKIGLINILCVLSLVYFSCSDDDKEVVDIQIDNDWVLINEVYNDTVFYPKYLEIPVDYQYEVNFPLMLILKDSEFEIKSNGIDNAFVGTYKLGQDNYINFLGYGILDFGRRQWELQFEYGLRFINNYALYGDTLIFKADSMYNGKTHEIERNPISFKLIKKDKFNFDTFFNELPDSIFLIPCG